MCSGGSTREHLPLPGRLQKVRDHRHDNREPAELGMHLVASTGVYERVYACAQPTPAGTARGVSRVSVAAGEGGVAAQQVNSGTAVLDSSLPRPREFQPF